MTGEPSATGKREGSGLGVARGALPEFHDSRRNRRIEELPEQTDGHEAIKLASGRTLDAATGEQVS